MDELDEAERITEELSLRLTERPEDWLKLTEAEVLALPDGGILSFLDAGFRDLKNYHEVKAYLIEKLQPPQQYFFETNDPEELNVLLDRAVLSGQKEVFFWPVLRVEEPRKLIRAGLFPTSLNIDAKWFSDYADGIDLATLKFWWSATIADLLANLKTESRWVYRSLDAWKEIALSTASSMGLRTFTGERDLYRASKRPANDMAMFRSPLSWDVGRADLARGEVELGGESWKLLPITRYAAGMRRGLFHRGEASSELECCEVYCGTFYYLEPESTTFLAYHTSHQSFNKHTAFKELIDLLRVQDPEYFHRVADISETEGDPEVVSYRNMLAKNKNAYFRAGLYRELNLFVTGKLPEDLMLTPAEAIQAKGYPSRAKVFLAAGASDDKYYASSYLSLYALEDEYDQVVCTLCRRLGIDVLILEKMPGSFQVVTEVLDSRSRTDSLRSLVYLR